MGKKKAHEDYVFEVSKINPNIEVIDRYVDAKTKIFHRCLIDGNEWMASPDNILHGKGCPVCGRLMTIQGSTKTHEQYVIDAERVNPNIDVIGRYETAHVKILHRCKIDGYEWLITPNDVLNGYGCPLCAGNMQLTTSTFKDKMSKINNDIEILGDYYNNKTKILCRCKIDGYEWNALPTNLIQGRGCPLCGGTLQKTHDEYVENVDKINQNIEVVGRYINVRTPILHKCKIDGCKWMAKPNNILSGRGCPICNQSHGERQVATFLDNCNIKYIRQYSFSDCVDKKPLPFDFYLPHYNVCIEFDGIQHFESVEIFGGYETFQITQHHDTIKTNYCLYNNITLLRIAYYQDVNTELDNFFENTKLIKEVS